MRLNRRGTKTARGGRGLATPAQLVAAAAGVFAESGFRGATVRDICRRAGANVAAVNYHFGGKEGLYAEVLRHGLRAALERLSAPPESVGTSSAPESAEARLRRFVVSFLERLLATGPDGCHGRLMMREMVDPTPALDTVVAGEIRGMTRYLEGLVAELLGPKASPEQIALGAASVVSQVVFYHHCRGVIPQAFPGLAVVSEDPERLAEHIVRFSMAGLDRIAAERGAGKGGNGAANGGARDVGRRRVARGADGKEGTV